jgi:hypothetical protein
MFEPEIKSRPLGDEPLVYTKVVQVSKHYNYHLTKVGGAG